MLVNVRTKLYIDSSNFEVFQNTGVLAVVVEGELDESGRHEQ